MTRAIALSVGRPLLEALAAFDRGDYQAAATRLRDVRPIAQRLGGSHAQRDLIDLTLIEAARRSGHLPLTRALVAERIQVKPGSAYNQALDLRKAAGGPVHQKDHEPSRNAAPRSLPDLGRGTGSDPPLGRLP